VSEAIHAANNLKAELKFTELETNFENTQSSSIGFLLSAKNLFTITDIVFGKLHHRLLVLKITSQENFTFSDRDTFS
jgi:hypothetical protein